MTTNGGYRVRCLWCKEIFVAKTRRKYCSSLCFGKQWSFVRDRNLYGPRNNTSKTRCIPAE